VQIVLLAQVLVECPFRIVPRAEVVHLAPDLLRPDAGIVSEQREVRTGFLRLFPAATGGVGVAA
jgi:hypothetical protein